MIKTGFVYKLLRPIIYVLFFIGALYGDVGYAQKILIKADVIGVLSNRYGGSVEYVLNENLSVSLGGHYVNINPKSNDTITLTTEKGYNIIPELRYYFSNRYEYAPSGLFVGANLIYEPLEVVVKTNHINQVLTSGQVNNIGIGAIAGYQWLINKRFALEFFFNPYFNNAKKQGDLNSEQGNIYYEERRGFQMGRVGFSLGVGF